MSDSTMPDWFMLDGQLMLRLPSGATIRPTAAEVVGAEFKGRLTVRNKLIARRPSDALPALDFSRYPPDVELLVTPPAADLSSPPQCFIQFSCDGKPIELRLPKDGDQTIVGESGWFPLPVNLLSDIRDVLKSAGIVEPGPLSFRQYLDLRRLDSGLVTWGGAPVTSPVTAGKSAAVIPAPNLNATLYPYQQTGFEWLCRISDEGLGCILGDQMGLGKTLQIIALFNREKPVRGKPCLVIAPATLLENWRREIARFAPSLSTTIHRGHTRSGFPRTLKTFDIVITSYETAMRDSSILAMVEWNVLVLDEAQAIKTPDAQRTVIIKTLPRRTAVAVSGTPVENRLRDLWSLMDFAVPGLLGDLKSFEQRFDDNVTDAAALEPLVTPLLLRRKVADVAQDLPQRIDIPQPVELSEQSAARYDAIRSEIAAQYGKAASLVALTKLRMFCTHPFLLENPGGDPLPHSTKYARLIELMDEIVACGEKVLIFTSYTEMADILAHDLRRRYCIPCEVIDGRTPVTDRQPAVDRFGEIMTSAALILNPRAAGTGLNITAANHVIHYNLEWNPALEDQATARAHRRGQTKPVTVHRLFHPGTVEEVIDQRMQRKRAIAGQAVIGTEGETEDMADIFEAMRLSPVFAGGTHP